MGTDLATPPAPTTVEKCGYCQVRVTWMETWINGIKLCFEAKPTPRYLDPDKLGWIPGQFTIGDARRTVYAPWLKHPSWLRRRADLVWRLHECAGLSPRQTVA